MAFSLFRQIPTWASAAALVAVLAACSGPSKPVPKDLGANIGLIGVKTAWSAQLGAMESSAQPHVVGSQVLLASAKGIVTALQGETGSVAWQLDVGTPLVSGVGSDGQTAAVMSEAGELIAMSSGKVLWKQRLGALGLTPPLVAGARIFTLTADRTVTAFDAASGQRLWQLQRSSDPLVLGQAGVLLAVGDTLVVGVAGRLLGVNPLNGASRWEAPVAVSRGTNEVERLVDLVAGVSRLQANVCVRSFQAAVACVNATNGTMVWNKPAAGTTGLGGDAEYVFGTEVDSKLIAWSRVSGERLWVSEALRWRALGTPLAVGQSLVVGDNAGVLHFLSRADGAPMDRATTDGSAILGVPVLVGKTLIAVTQKGGVFAFRPE
ncbi:outer membrane protein assembly factor BamB [Rhodoferax sp. TS-BS-61-7]|uniref:outer membrane protein assembly factor BamB n=1 Tax=Rhodoferax sp. TS-BS-61-7 TaxID=2094194 RepID=UPI000CF5F34D|nr:outer membrane protein assembly factor BamB [Rhodoferax sp. TS-BS-61-7]PQA75779.1 outer membrane protein assembly factor BamB [Rhodoferax sp. TS-BS-61-7]